MGEQNFDDVIEKMTQRGLGGIPEMEDAERIVEDANRMPAYKLFNKYTANEIQESVCSVVRKGYGKGNHYFG